MISVVMLEVKIADEQTKNMIGNGFFFSSFQFILFLFLFYKFARTRLCHSCPTAAPASLTKTLIVFYNYYLLVLHFCLTIPFSSGI